MAKVNADPKLRKIYDDTVKEAQDNIDRHKKMRLKRKVNGTIERVEVVKKKHKTSSALRADAIKKMRKENDLIWSAIVKMFAECQSEKVPDPQELIDHPSRQLNSHHFFRKEMYPWLRWEVRNGLCIFSWQHVLARGSAHDDPAQFDAWALPYMTWRGDLEYLQKKAMLPEKITPMFIEEANKVLRDMFYETSGNVWGE